jgi:hypothetical protein
MTAKKRATKSADAVILDVLGYEFPFDDRTEAERKMKRRLRYHGLGPYQQGRVNLLRRLKDEIQCEVHRGVRSRYFTASRRRYAAREDFDIERMIEDFSQLYPDVPHEEIKAFLPFAIYLYYLR